MGKALIGVTADFAVNEYGTRQVQANWFYTRAVERAGGLALVTAADPALAEELADRLDGLLLTGGGDLNPALYGQAVNGSVEIDDDRDACEMALCKAMLTRGKPILGICRGIQLLNVALGGTLIQDIPSQRGIDHPYGLPVRHDARIGEGSFLDPSLWGVHKVNSTHHQCVQTLGKGLKTAATSENGALIEAVESAEGKPFWGVQWHPERLLDEDPAMLTIFSRLVRESRG